MVLAVAQSDPAISILETLMLVEKHLHMRNPVAQAVLWASSGWMDSSRTYVMKTCDPDSSS